MAARFNVGLTGDKELEQALANVTEKVERKVLRAALRRAALGVLRVAQANIASPRVRIAPGTSQRRARQLQRLARRFGRLRNSLSVKLLSRRKGRVGYQVVTGTRAELGIGGNARYYYPAHVELGHAAPHRGKGALRSVLRHARRLELGDRRTPPHPYLRPALKSRQGEVLAQLSADIRAGLARENLRSG